MSAEELSETRLATPPESELDAEEFVAALLPKLRATRVMYFPIRHHSPACAVHLQRWIRDNRPSVILVEGPSSFTKKIDLLTSENCKCPVAIYTNFVDKQRRLDKHVLEDSSDSQKGDSAEEPENLSRDLSAPRFAAYYPFCDYSPELVALREGKKIGARLRFVDLDYGEMILTRVTAEKELPDSVALELLSQDAHLKHSRYIKDLAEKLACRNFDDLWDHLFESCCDELSTDAFIDRLATYCAMARLDFSQKELLNDSTLAREDCMASAINDELEKSDGKILVVTGGFHTVALPDAVARRNTPSRYSFKEGENSAWLMRYSFDRLDALSGYSSGMPAPAFYDRIWSVRAESEQPDANLQHLDKSLLFANLEEVSLQILVEIGRLTREQQSTNLISTPDAIAAARMVKQLSLLRGHPYPTREDLLDGIRSCFVKGELGVEGRPLFRLVHEVLAGSRVGQVPPETELPPIVDDFRREASRLRLSTDGIDKRECTLDIYKNKNHRDISRFFYRLDFMHCPYARFLSGPDFVAGQRLDITQEHWEVSWSPMTESCLIEASIYGSTLEEAVGTLLKIQIEGLEDAGKGRSSQAVVQILLRACRLGLHAHSLELIPLIDRHIAEDPSLISLAKALSQLELLQSAREPLEAFHLPALPELMMSAFARACRLIPDLPGCPNEDVDAALRALQILVELESSSRTNLAIQNVLDKDLFFNALFKVIAAPPHLSQSAVVGAAAGILYREGKLTEEELVNIVCGYLGAAVNDPAKCAGILRGLLSTACEISWQIIDLMSAINEQFSAWDESTFLNLLPELRLAFSALNPRDISRVAELISALHDGQKVGPLVHTDLDERELLFGIALNDRVQKALIADGLQGE